MDKLFEALYQAADTVIAVHDSEEIISIEPEDARKMFDAFFDEVRKISVPTAVLLTDADVCIEKAYGGRYDIYLVLPKPFAVQFQRQKIKVQHLKIAAEKLFGKNNFSITINNWKSEKIRRHVLDTNKWWSESPRRSVEK